MTCKPSVTSAPPQNYTVGPYYQWPDYRPYITPRYDYGLRTCPTCKGTGINPVNSYVVCPKCNGETKVPV